MASEAPGVLLRVESQTLHIFDLRRFKTKEVEIATPLPSEPAFFQMPGVLFVSGGEIGGQDAASAKAKISRGLSGVLLDGLCLDYVKMRGKRKSHSVTGDGPHLFASGGADEAGQLEACELFTLSYNKWEGLPELNQARSQHGSCFFESSAALYVFGGRAGSDEINLIERLQLG